jgi:FlaG/FlaF family flagellin (archaellin)
MKWLVVALVVILVGAISVWTFLSQKANQNRTYSGAKFIEFYSGSISYGKL